MKHILLLATVAFCSISAQAVDVDVYFNRKHTVGNVDHLERSKFITIHSAEYDKLKPGGDELMDYLINDLDVHYGRETGRVTGMARSYSENVSKEDEKLKKQYNYYNEFYKKQNSQDLIIAGQYRLYDRFVENASHDYALAGKNYGDYLSKYLVKNFANSSADKFAPPEYIELLNEPLWDPIDQYLLWLEENEPTKEEEQKILQEHFLFHKEAAREIHRQLPATKVGGFVEAFPDPEYRDFFNWETRWKYFIDSCGADMDFYTFHLYDFHCQRDTIQQFRKGGNMEAFMDLLSHYNMLTHGEEKQFVISEYGSRAHCIEADDWTSYRDWLSASSINSMLVQFMDRPDMIDKTMPYIMAVWSKTWNIFRPDKKNAVFTDYVKFYQLWANVSGTRLYTLSSDLDIQVDAYANGNKTYLIINNLETNSVTVNVSELGITESNITSTLAKNFYLNDVDSVLVLDTTIYNGAPQTINISSMGTVILEYTTAEPSKIAYTYTETRNYADKYKQQILADKSVNLIFNNIDIVNDGKATLRIGLGRDHGLSLQPVVKINGTELKVPNDYRGDTQGERLSFFGLLEIDVPYNLLKEANTVTIEFPDNGGYISSSLLRVYNLEEGDIQVNK